MPRRSLFPWTLAGLLLAYLACFVRPILLEPPAMQFPTYLPAGEVHGGDLRAVLHNRRWIEGGASDGIRPLPYPPLAEVMFSPLRALEFDTAYGVMTLMTLGCFVAMAFWLPQHFGADRPRSPAAVLAAVAGLWSYGLHFELERGQFNVIAVACALAAIHIYHRYERARWLALILLTAAVQMKIYPAIFALLLFDGDVRRAARTAAVLLAANVACLFALGTRRFSAFVGAVIEHSRTAEIVHCNHSIASFSASVTHWAGRHGVALLAEHPSVIANVLFLAVCAGTVCVAITAYRRRAGADPYLLLACTVAGMVIPASSYDYKLPILVVPVAILLGDLEHQIARGAGDASRLTLWLVLALSSAYACTLFSYTSKPAALQNNLPLLMAVMLAAVLLQHHSHDAAGMPAGAAASGGGKR